MCWRSHCKSKYSERVSGSVHIMCPSEMLPSWIEGSTPDRRSAFLLNYLCVCTRELWCPQWVSEWVSTLPCKRSFFNDQFRLVSYSPERCMPGQSWFGIGVSGTGDNTLGILPWDGSRFVWTFPASFIKYLIIHPIRVLHRFLASGIQT